MSTAFVLDAIATSRRERTTRRGGQPAPDVETDWHTCALVLRAMRAMTTGEPVRLRCHNDSVHTGRVTRLCDSAPNRDGTTVAVELDTGTCLHLADVTAIAPTPRPAAVPGRRDPRLAACAHAFGYRGHCLTKSRRYSTTFKQLRAEREAFVHAQIVARSRDVTQRALADAEQRVVMLEVDGVGHVTDADRYYALAEHNRARERRRIGREECCDQPRRTRRAGRRLTEREPLREGEAGREAVQDG